MTHFTEKVHFCQTSDSSFVLKFGDIDDAKLKMAMTNDDDLIIIFFEYYNYILKHEIEGYESKYRITLVD